MSNPDLPVLERRLDGGRQHRTRCVQRDLDTAQWGKGQLVLLRRLRGRIVVGGCAAVTCRLKLWPTGKALIAG